MLVLRIRRIDPHRNLAYRRVGLVFIRIGPRIRAIVDGGAYPQARHTLVVQPSHIGRRSEVIDLEDTLLATGHPSVTIETVGIQASHHLSLVIEAAIPSAPRTEKGDTGLVPSGGQDGGFPFWSGGTKEMDRLVMGIGQANRYDQMTGTHIEGRMDQSGQVKLLDGHLATLLHLGLILAILGILQLVSRTGSTRLKLDLRPQHPLAVELVIQGQDKARDRDRVSMFLGVSIRSAIEAVDAIILEVGHHLTIPSDPELLVTRGIDSFRPFRSALLSLQRATYKAAYTEYICK